MVESLNSVLADTYRKLLDQLVELQTRLDKARSCRDQSECVLCSFSEPCVPHAQLQALLSTDSEIEIANLRVQLSNVERALINANARIASLDAHVAEIPKLIEDAKLQAVAERKELIERDSQTLEFLTKIATRLGIRNDSTQERLRSMIDDAIRKLMS